MKTSLGQIFTRVFKKWIPEPFVFALILTMLVAACALLFTNSNPSQVVTHWYEGFWMLLEFSMQMVLILATGFAIALSPPAARIIDKIAKMAKTPASVYIIVLVVGGLFSLVSWGWVVLTAVLGRELAKRVEGVDYAYLIAAVYLAGQPWVGGLSSSIALMLNTEGNFLIESGILTTTLSTAQTLGSHLNIAYICSYFLILPPLIWWMRPHKNEVTTLSQLQSEDEQKHISVAEEAQSYTLDKRSVSDRLNNSSILQSIIGLAAAYYVAQHFLNNGFDLNLNLMIFAFLAIGLLVHRTPSRFGIAMKRACANVYGLIFQYPFYAGIMGIMMFSGLGSQISLWLAEGASMHTLPLIAQFAGASVNFAIPSAGGQWAVIGPAITEAAINVSTHLPPDQQQAFIARIAMAVAYGETSTNLLQPFFLLTVLPIMGAGVLMQARDIMGYLVVPFMVIYVFSALLVTFMPM